MENQNHQDALARQFMRDKQTSVKRNQLDFRRTLKSQNTHSKKFLLLKKAQIEAMPSNTAGFNTQRSFKQANTMMNSVTGAGTIEENNSNTTLTRFPSTSRLKSAATSKHGFRFTDASHLNQNSGQQPIKKFQKTEMGFSMNVKGLKNRK